MEIKRIRTGSLTSLERSDLHVMDGTSRIAIVNHWTVDSYLREVDSSSGLNQNKIRYQYSNHLGSASLELNSTGQIISYEEYFPYGGTSFTTGQSQKEVKLKEYRYTGKERDDATGLYYYGARYYASWLGRWLSCDPAGTADGLNLYEYVRGNPVGLVDPEGMEGTPVFTRHEDGTFSYMLAERQLDEVRSSTYQDDCFTAARAGAENGAWLLEGETPELLDANFGIGGNWKGFREGTLTQWENEERITKSEYDLMAEKQLNIITLKDVNENMVGYIIDSVLEGLPVMVGVNRKEFDNEAGKEIGNPGVMPNKDGITYRKINEGVTNHWLIATGFRVNTAGMVDQIFAVDNVGGVDVIFNVDPASREISKPIENPQSPNYVRRSGYQVTQLRLWRGVEPTMKTTGAGVWMQKDVWKR